MASPHKITQKELKKKASRFLDLGVLFPKSRVNSRTKLNSYQERKIKRALKEVEKIANGATAMENDFVPLKGYKRFNAAKGLPEYVKGFFLQGGDRDNTNAEYDDGKIHYLRGGTERLLIQLNNWSENTLMTTLDKALTDVPTDGTKMLTANGRTIINSSTNDDAAIKIRAREIFNKYKTMAANGEYRVRPGRKDASGQDMRTLAAHPRKWGIGLLHEAPPPKMTASQSWNSLTPEYKATLLPPQEYKGLTVRQAYIKAYNKYNK